MALLSETTAYLSASRYYVETEGDVFTSLLPELARRNTQYVGRETDNLTSPHLIQSMGDTYILR